MQVRPMPRLPNGQFPPKRNQGFHREWEMGSRLDAIKMTNTWNFVVLYYVALLFFK